MMHKGQTLCIHSGPSGTGKGRFGRALAQRPKVFRSVSGDNPVLREGEQTVHVSLSTRNLKISIPHRMHFLSMLSMWKPLW